jgi:hypothetical protein
MKTIDELESMNKAALIDYTLKNVVLPVVKSADNISFASLQYVEDVMGALLKTKRADGPAWKAASKLLDVTVDLESHVHLELKVHGIDLGKTGGSALSHPDFIKFEY